MTEFPDNNASLTLDHNAALQAIKATRARVMSRVIGQDALIDRLLIALICDGHLLVEGAPGLAKTSTIKALADCIEASFHRVQFTPDLLPADITGSDVYSPGDHGFVFHEGPVFNNLLLADEINRAPAKVQSALLEAMEERQVTIGDTSRPLPEPFLVMATQNPIEQHGTYPLPEAQLDRFMLRVRIYQPDADTEQQILNLNNDLLVRQLSSVDATNSSDEADSSQVLTPDHIKGAREAVLSVHMAPALQRYLVDLVVATRQAGTHVAELDGLVQLGASTRASLSLDRGARARALLDGRDHVLPQDIHELAHDTLCHRISLSYQAITDGVSSDNIVDALIDSIVVP